MMRGGDTELSIKGKKFLIGIFRRTKRAKLYFSRFDLLSYYAYIFRVPEERGITSMEVQVDESERFFKGNRKRIPFPLRVIAKRSGGIQMECFFFITLMRNDVLF